MNEDSGNEAERGNGHAVDERLASKRLGGLLHDIESISHEAHVPVSIADLPAELARTEQDLAHRTSR